MCLSAASAHFAGTQCARGKGGFICQHRNAVLGSIEPRDGVITCPLHGLRIGAQTGVVLP
ncbi:MAG: Rieske 2Fe-2S domain-containing protein [Xanthobacteraceae bacterium]|nr:Rieske 2Fe-2S domain-containing protein [Xanthobacteraceae bacterium]